MSLNDKATLSFDKLHSVIFIVFFPFRFLAFSTGISDSAQQSVAGQKRTANVEQATGLLSSLIGETSVTQRWVVSALSYFISYYFLVIS